MADGGSLSGKKLGAYRVESMLGQGAMGEVYRAVHEQLGRPVAIKTLKPQIADDASLLERFFAEARAVNIIRHENIVECTDMVNEPGGQSYIVMEMLEGKTLAQAIRDSGSMPAKRAVRIAAQIADAIAAAHEKGIVHRDLKPDNVFLIKRAGTSDYVKVLDFGIARLRPEYGITATQSGALIGTPAYMSPEQASGERAGPASDIYALGVILYHMIVGRLPFAAASLPAILMAQVGEIPARVDAKVPDCPAALADAIARALEKKPEARQASMNDLRTELLVAVGLPVELTASILAQPSGVQGAVTPTPSAVGATVGAAVRGSGERSGSQAARVSTAPSAFEATAAPASDRIIGASSVSGSVGEISGARGAVPNNLTTASTAKRRTPIYLAGAAVIAAGAIAAVVIAGKGGSTGGGGKKVASDPAGAGASVPPPTVQPADAAPAKVAAIVPDAGSSKDMAEKAMAEVARSHFDRGQAQFIDSQYQAAADEFMAAYAAAPMPTFLFNAAVSYEKLGDTAKAIELYQRYLDEDPKATDRQKIAARIAALKARVKTAPPKKTPVVVKDPGKDQAKDPVKDPAKDPVKDPVPPKKDLTKDLVDDPTPQKPPPAPK